MGRISDMLATSTHWVEILLNDYFKNLSEQDTYHKSTSFHPSQAGACPRALWYSLMGYKASPTSITSQRNLSLGHAFHEMLEKAFESSSFFLSKEEKVSWLEDDTLARANVAVPLSGRCDILLLRPRDNSKYLIEIKSHKDTLTEGILLNEGITYGKWDSLKEPYISHIYQWQLYSLMTDALEGCIFYVNKNNTQFKVFEQKQNITIIQEILAKFDDIYQHVKKKELYPFQPSEQHSWCKFKDQCQIDFKQETGNDGTEYFRRSIYSKNK